MPSIYTDAEKEELVLHDYIEKPYDMDIMLAKIKGIFKRTYGQDEIFDNDLIINKENKIGGRTGRTAGSRRSSESI